jgi:hypothetical protein
MKPDFATIRTAVNDHLRSRRLEFSATGRKGKRTSVLLSLNLQSRRGGICMARINLVNEADEKNDLNVHNEITIKTNPGGKIA